MYIVTKEHVIGNLLGTTTPREVVVRLDAATAESNPLRLGDYLAITYANRNVTDPVLARVTDIGLVNLNMPESILTGPEEFATLLSISDLHDGEVLTAKAQVVGYIDEDGKIVSPRFSPRPRARVTRASSGLLSRIFSVGHIEIGSLMGHEGVRVKLDVGKLVTRHLAVLSLTGGGKGNTVAVITSRMLELGAAIVIVDPHDEYVAMQEDLGDRAVVFSVNRGGNDGIWPLRLRCNSFATRDYFSILKIPMNAVKQRSLLRRALGELRGRTWGREDLVASIRESAGDREHDQRCSSHACEGKCR